MSAAAELREWVEQGTGTLVRQRDVPGLCSLTGTYLMSTRPPRSTLTVSAWRSSAFLIEPAFFAICGRIPEAWVRSVWLLSAISRPIPDSRLL